PSTMTKDTGLPLVAIRIRTTAAMPNGYSILRSQNWNTFSRADFFPELPRIVGAFLNAAEPMP
ncbi:hypothetical protein ACCS43_36465, partial [Rhizobium ruizarguesonis]